jgi:RNA polymerase sigma-70 factor (ECF subfamily)
VNARVRTFLDAFDASSPWRAALGPSELEAVLDAAVSDVRAQWPELAADDAFVLQGLADAVRDAEPSSATLAGVRAADVTFARACILHDATALELFDRRVLPSVESALARIFPERLQRDDAMQGLRKRLLVSEGQRRPKLAEYTGFGPLRAWLRVVAVRDALKLRRRYDREVRMPGTNEDDALFARSARLDDAELERLKALHLVHVHEAFKSAIGRLEDKDKNLLRYHYLDELSLEQVAGLYGVHRATAARWLAQARETLLESTRRELMRKLGVTEGECESLVRFVLSRFDGSFARAFAESIDEKR